MVFEIFSGELRELIKKRFDRPTSVQFEGIPPIREGKNTLIMAPTGMGKTESVLLPIFDMWLAEKPSPISILYLTPLKSLNRNLLSRIEWWAEHLDFEVSVRHGDTSQYERSMQASNPADMFISTPETLQSMLTGKIMRNHLKNVRWIVMDEVHELVGSKRGVQLSIGLERLRELIKAGGGKKPQTIALSATIGTPEEVAKFITSGECKIINTAGAKKMNIRVEAPEPGPEDADIADSMLVSPETAARLRRVMELIKSRKSTLVFTNTREFAEVLSSRIRSVEPSLPMETHHSSLSKEVRVDAENKFREEKIKALVCTSSLELGIDIGSIDQIVQYMSPRQVAKILQRVGRSGHSFNRMSDGVIIATDPDDCLEAAVIARHALKSMIEPTPVYKNALDVLGHQIVGMSLEEYRISVEKAYGIVKRSYTYRDLTMDDFMSVCQLMQRLGLLWIDTKFSEEPLLKRRQKSWVYYYSNLSTIPDVKNYRIIDIVTNKPVGSLDAEFVAMHGTAGTYFIVKGQTWRIIDLRGGKVFVEPAKGMDAAIPAWEGELLPVPYEIAVEVGRLRGEVGERLGKGRENDAQSFGRSVDRFIAKHRPT